jgi:hypothetical protein
MTEEEFNTIIKLLKSDLLIYSEMLQEVASDIIRNGFSKYPVFIASDEGVKMGELILDKQDYAATFSIYATTLEELSEKNIINEAKRESFITSYKNPKTHVCVLLITKGIASVAFYPYHAKEIIDNGKS